MAGFISFEGPDGSGKSTQARLLAAVLRDQGQTVLETREPGGTLLGERLRELLLDPGSPRATPLVMALLLSASRAQHLEEVILPALGRGETVICDRYADSTIAYQADGLGLDRQVVRELTAIATDGVRPDVVVLVDVPPEVGLGRIAARGGANRLDAEGVRFQERVRAGYHRLAAEEPERWICVDGSGSPDEVHSAIMQALQGKVTGTP